MAGKVPFVRQVGWLSVLPQLVVLVALMAIFWRFRGEEAVLPAALTYLALSMGLRYGISRAHRKGVRLMRRGAFKEAIPYFEESYSFFSRYAWVDRWRYITLLSSSAISYREMALCNIAFCYGQSGDGPNCKKYYEKALAEFPDSAIARASLKMFEALGK